jgi:hypothetical protein
MYEVTEKQEELFALGTTVLEQFCRDTVCSRSLVIGHAKKSLVDFFRRESRAKCRIVFCVFLAEAVHRGGTAVALRSFRCAGDCRGSEQCLIVRRKGPHLFHCRRA